ncbi:MAG: type II toxin-antitoxin system HicA family toxin [Gammaproteobacteria bacterium]|nr:type II toxin-antitoxin system HicA family toxin [Gammaproteobacteria bacterium]
MKRNELLRYLRSQGCELLREGGRHSWWHHPQFNTRSAVPRHTEIDDLLARKICKDLGVPPLGKK